MKAQDVDDHDLCLHGFAKRGAGVGAVAPATVSPNNSGVVESFRTVLPNGGTKPPPSSTTTPRSTTTSSPTSPTRSRSSTTARSPAGRAPARSFAVYANAPAGSADVCRFFSTSFTPKSSHFYTPDANECGIVKAQRRTGSSKASSSACWRRAPPATARRGRSAVYRLYNNGQGGAPNHRYTTSLATRARCWARAGFPKATAPA